MMDIHTSYSRYVAGDITCLDSVLESARRIALAAARGLRCMDPDDVAQRATIQVWRNLRSYDPARASMPTWIGGIVRRCATDAHRAAPSHDALPLVEEATQPVRIDYLTLDTGHLTDEGRRTVAVFALDPDFDSAASTLGISVSALKKRLYRIVAKKGE
jgi:DNA-directed RNA polymerase specialized sigma24 family protein